MDDTTNLKLPYILAAQSQKHVTHNEALRALDALVQLSVLDRDLAAPPSSPAEGARYIVAASPTGAWSGKSGAIAAFQDGAWSFHDPLEGWLAWVADEDALFVFDGTGWIANPAGAGVNPVPLVGVNATADSSNRLAVSSAASLFNHAGSGHQLKINKSAAGQTGSVLFQTAFSGRAEFGLAGDDDFHVKVSADGSAWHEGLVIDRANGAVRVKAGTVDVASAATCNIGAAAAQRVRITGTTTITSFGTVANELRHVHFASALTLTHHATSLVLPGAANIVTEAGDTAIFASDASGNWRCLDYQRANGRGLGISAFAATLLDDANLGSLLQTLGLRVALGVVADDGVSVVSGLTSGLFFAFTASSSTLRPSIVYYRAASTPETILLAQTASGGPAPNLTTGALTGTTGTDGVVNISADASGNLYFENRRGFAATFYGFLLNGIM